MGRRARRGWLVGIAACIVLLVPDAAHGADCRTKPGRAFDIKMSGSDTATLQTDDGEYSSTETWSARFKKVRMDVTRCDGQVRRITLDAKDGRVKTSVAYTEPDIITVIEPCDSDFFCPRQTQTEEGCRFRYRGTFRAEMHLNAWLRDKPSVSVSAGPAEDDQQNAERAAQRDACGDAGRVGFISVPPFAADGLEWDLGSYFLNATAESTPQLVRDLVRGEGGTASGGGSRGRENSEATVEATMTFGKGEPVRNRFPEGFSASTSQALNAILAFDPGRTETLDTLHEAMRGPGEIQVRGLRGPLRSDDPDRRWAAAYVGQIVVNDPADVDALRPLLRDRDPSVRALGAFGVVAQGARAALPVLVDLVGNEGLLNNSDGEGLAQLADERLELVTRANRSGPRAWRRWWRQVKGTIRWDRSARRYRWRGARRASAAVVRPPAPVAHASADPVTIRFPVRIVWAGNVTAAQKRAIRRNLERAIDFLNGDGRTGRCTPIAFELDLVEGGPARPGYYTIDVNQVKNTNLTRVEASYIDNVTKRGRLWTERAAGELGDEMIAHELGHVAGLPDEYWEATANGRKLTIPVDPGSIMGGPDGGLLQRHLDFLSRLHDPDGHVACERWVLRFGTWTSTLDPWTDEGGSTTTNWLGLSATAGITAYFWAPSSGELFPAGTPVCGNREVVQGRTRSQPNGRTSPCPDLGGGGEALDARMFEGQADCGPLSLRFAAPRFAATVTGSRSPSGFSLRLAVEDQQIARASRCDPAAEPGEAESYSLIRDGMKFAGALRFTMAPPSKAFVREGEHSRAEGTATLTRIEPPG